MSEGAHKAHMGNKAQIHSTTDSSSALSVWGCVCTCVCKYASEFELLLLLLCVSVCVEPAGYCDTMRLF